jgi:DNA-directed RNA polymerase subunit M/transcription elongation factor TFIIS
MPMLTCPRCGARGELRGTDETFQPRGHVGRVPVRKCRKCGAGIAVRFRFLMFGARAELIANETWSDMERRFARAVGGAPTQEKPFVCGECGKGFKSAQAREDHVTSVH